MSKAIKIIWVIDRIAVNKTLANPNIDILRKHFDVELWDIRNLNNHWRKQHGNFRFEDEAEYPVFYLKQYSEVKERIEALKKNGTEAGFLFSGSVSFWNRRVIRLIEKNEFPYFFKRNSIGYCEGEFTRLTSVINIDSWYKKIINRLYYRLINGKFLQRGLKGPTLFFAGTQSELDKVNLPLNPSGIIFTHSKDYDSFLLARDEKPYKEGKYFLFIDQYLPFHPETAHLGIDADDYYGKINSFLKRIETLLGYPYVIAAHPASDINIIRNYFDAKRLFIKKTMPLLNHSELAITINSTTALSAVITQTPMLLLDSKGLLPEQNNEITKVLAGIIKANIVTLEQPLSKEALETMMGKQKQESGDVFSKYIKHTGTPDNLEFEIISAEIKRHFNPAFN
jgi:hypothetical protein